MGDPKLGDPVGPRGVPSTFMSGPSGFESDIDDVVSGDPGTDTSSAEQLEREIAEIRGTEAGLRFEDRREARRGRLSRASAAAFEAAHRVGAAIPFGQPILVGHHSEGRHRRDLRRIDQSMERGVEAHRRSEELARRAESVGQAGISSDDPAAVQELSRKLLRLEEAQAQMKAANLAIRTRAKAGPEAQVQALIDLGFSEDRARQILRPDFAQRIGFPSYALSNNNAEISRVKKRIAELTARAATPARTPVQGSIEGLAYTISEDPELHRTQIRFSGKPSEDLRKRLRSAGFLWAPSEGAWQRQLSNQAWHRAGYALGITMT